MAQITIYLPDDVAAHARQMAKRAKKSLSAYVGELLTRESSAGNWPSDLLDLLDRGRADLTEPDDPPPEDVEPLG